MNSLLTREDILRSDREAAAVALREPSILFRLFSGFRNQQQDAVVSGVPAPIIAVEEIHDNDMVLESILSDFCAHLELDPELTMTYHHLMMARLGVTPVIEKEAFPQLEAWFKADVLPKNFRRVFVEYIVRVDDLENNLSNLSQYRWERLRSWSNAHV